MDGYKLYIMETCPYCVSVINFIKKKGLEIELVDIRDDRADRDFLKEVGGKVQVPALLMEDGSFMYESKEIIDYINMRFK